MLIEAQKFEDIFAHRQTSASFYKSMAQEKFVTTNEDGSHEVTEKYFLIHDLYIKAWSYSIINKLAFWFCILFAILVIAWPSFSVVINDANWSYSFLQSSVVQTSVTAFAAAFFATYSHYKKRQMQVENLMREVLMSDKPLHEITDIIISEMAKMDLGFAFSSVKTSDAKK